MAAVALCLALLASACCVAVEGFANGAPESYCALAPGSLDRKHGRLYHQTVQESPFELVLYTEASYLTNAEYTPGNIYEVALRVKPEFVGEYSIYGYFIRDLHRVNGSFDVGDGNAAYEHRDHNSFAAPAAQLRCNGTAVTHTTVGNSRGTVNSTQEARYGVFSPPTAVPWQFQVSLVATSETFRNQLLVDADIANASTMQVAHFTVTFQPEAMTGVTCGETSFISSCSKTGCYTNPVQSCTMNGARAFSRLNGTLFVGYRNGVARLTESTMALEMFSQAPGRGRSYFVQPYDATDLLYCNGFEGLPHCEKRKMSDLSITKQPVPTVAHFPRDDTSLAIRWETILLQKQLWSGLYLTAPVRKDEVKLDFAVINMNPFERNDTRLNMDWEGFSTVFPNINFYTGPSRGTPTPIPPYIVGVDVVQGIVPIRNHPSPNLIDPTRFIGSAVHNNTIWFAYCTPQLNPALPDLAYSSLPRNQARPRCFFVNICAEEGKRIGFDTPFQSILGAMDINMFDTLREIEFHTVPVPQNAPITNLNTKDPKFYYQQATSLPVLGPVLRGAPSKEESYDRPDAFTIHADSPTKASVFVAAYSTFKDELALIRYGLNRDKPDTGDFEFETPSLARLQAANPYSCNRTIREAGLDKFIVEWRPVSEGTFTQIPNRSGYVYATEFPYLTRLRSPLEHVTILRTMAVQVNPGLVITMFFLVFNPTGRVHVVTRRDEPASRIVNRYRHMEDIELGAVVDEFEVQGKHLIATTRNDKILRMSLSRCHRFDLCGQCGADSNPFCGFCTASRLCTESSECSSTWIQSPNFEDERGCILPGDPSYPAQFNFSQAPTPNVTASSATELTVVLPTEPSHFYDVTVDGVTKRVVHPATTLVFTGLTAFTRYSVHVSQLIALVGRFNSTAFAHTLPARASMMTVLESVPNTTSMSLSWPPPNPANGAIERYVLLRDGSEVCCTTAVASFEDTGLMPASPYSYTIAAVTGENSEFQGPASPTFTFTTSEQTPGPPGTPAVSNNGARTVSLSWAAPAAPNGAITAYRLYLDGVEQPSDPTAANGPTTTAVLFGLTPATNYTVAVEAVNSAGTSPLSAALQFTTASEAVSQVAAPTVALESASTSVRVSWTVPTTGSNPSSVVQYRVLRGTSPSAAGQVVFTGAALAYLDTNVPPCTTHYYRVAADVSVSPLVSTESLPSSIMTGSGAPSTPSAPRLLGTPSTGSVTLTWDEPECDAERFSVKRSTGGGAPVEVCCTGGSKLDRFHHDTSLAGGTAYSYTVEQMLRSPGGGAPVGSGASLSLVATTTAGGGVTTTTTAAVAPTAAGGGGTTTTTTTGIGQGPTVASGAKAASSASSAGLGAGLGVVILILIVVVVVLLVARNKKNSATTPAASSTGFPMRERRESATPIVPFAQSDAVMDYKTRDSLLDEEGVIAQAVDSALEKRVSESQLQFVDFSGSKPDSLRSHASAKFTV